MLQCLRGRYITEQRISHIRFSIKTDPLQLSAGSKHCRTSLATSYGCGDSTPNGLNELNRPCSKLYFMDVVTVC